MRCHVTSRRVTRGPAHAPSNTARCPAHLACATRAGATNGRSERAHQSAFRKTRRYKQRQNTGEAKKIQYTLVKPFSTSKVIGVSMMSLSSFTCLHQNPPVRTARPSSASFSHWIRNMHCNILQPTATKTCLASKF